MNSDQTKVTNTNSQDWNTRHGDSLRPSLTEQKEWNFNDFDITFSDGELQAKVRKAKIILYRTFSTTDAKYASYLTLTFEKIDYWGPTINGRELIHTSFFDKNDVLLERVDMDEMPRTCKVWSGYNSNRDIDPKYFDAVDFATPGSGANTYSKC